MRICFFNVSPSTRKNTRYLCPANKTKERQLDDDQTAPLPPLPPPAPHDEIARAGPDRKKKIPDLGTDPLSFSLLLALLRGPFAWRAHVLPPSDPHSNSATCGVLVTVPTDADKKMKAAVTAATMAAAAATMAATTVTTTATTVQALPAYQMRIPNGAFVPGAPGVGHKNPAGGGATNQFGADFRAAGHVWTVALCQKDSDGDGMTNGEELGDPTCVWKPGKTPTRTTDITHPGVKNAAPPVTTPAPTTKPPVATDAPSAPSTGAPVTVTTRAPTAPTTKSTSTSTPTSKPTAGKPTKKPRGRKTKSPTMPPTPAANEYEGGSDDDGSDSDGDD